MLIVASLVLGLVTGTACTLILLMHTVKKLKSDKSIQDERAQKLQEGYTQLKARESALARKAEEVDSQWKAIESRVIPYETLKGENSVLKRELRNLDVHFRKLQLDLQTQGRTQEELDDRIRELGSRYLSENVKWLARSLTPNNFAASKKRLLDVIQRCRNIGHAVSPDEESQLVMDLKEEYEKVVRAAVEREEQARIKAQIREEQRLEREIERELAQLERERAAVAAALEAAIERSHGEYSAEVERLKARLAEAEEKSQRAISRAQLTKSGHVYVISNLGSFGEHIYKIGMTRRLEPNDRVRELGDASVPFPFDVHMMISADDAPALENALHRALHKQRLNKVNLRREFFRANLEQICDIVRAHHGEVEYVADAEALEFRQSLEMSEEDYEYIESVYDQLEDDGVFASDED